MLSFIPFFSFLAFFHPVYLSMTEIEYDQEAQALEIVHRVFIEDIERALEETHGVKIRMGTQQEHPKTDEWLADYIRQTTWYVLPNGRKLQGELLGKETNLEHLWVYVEVSQVRPMATLRIHNAQLMELFEDQINIIRFRYKDQSQSTKLTTQKPEDIFRL